MKAQGQLETSIRDIETLQESERSLRHRLEECKQVIATNNNVIEFLQKDLLRMKEAAVPSFSSTTTSIAGMGIAHTDLGASTTSAYKFRPKYPRSQS